MRKDTGFRTEEKNVLITFLICKGQQNKNREAKNSSASKYRSTPIIPRSDSTDSSIRDDQRHKISLLYTSPFVYKAELFNEFVLPASVLNYSKFIDLCQAFNIPHQSRVKLYYGKDFDPSMINYAGQVPSSKNFLVAHFKCNN